MIMGLSLNSRWYAITVNFCVMILNLSSFSQSQQPMINNSLDDHLYNYSSKQISQRVHTGVLYNISLPSNFSGMEVSLLRLRGSTLWEKGANFSFIHVPPRVLTMPYVKRVEILYENLGNFSSLYHNLPGYTFLTAILGIAVYDATDLSGSTRVKRLGIQIRDKPITVKFPEFRVPEDGKVVTHVTCVMFNPSNGNVELSKMTSPNVCSWQALGHFGVAVPSNVALSPNKGPMPMPHSPRTRKDDEWEWWVIGFAGGLVGLGLLVLVSVVCYRTFVSRKIRKMERKTEKSESLGTTWIGNSRMPLASMTRTQPTNLENYSNP